MPEHPVNSTTPLMLMILDGWGYRESTDYNAVRKAETPVLDRLFREYPHTLMGASGLDVGLPPGQMGNSEVGHQNLGAGRIVYQDFTRITRAIENGNFFSNSAFSRICETVKKRGSVLHLMGLVSDGGVHSHLDHLKALVTLAADRGLSKVCLHAFLDGRDTPPTSGVGYLRKVESFLREKGVGRFATVMGRYYAMDRDSRWDRVEKAYRTMVEGGSCRTSVEEAVSASYRDGNTDEFVPPMSIVPPGEAPAVIRDGDGIIFFNFRSDRAREITRAFTEETFSGFARKHIDLASFVCMTEYDETFSLPVAFPPHSLKNIFAEVISRQGLRQLRIAETEKYAHVTFFFNGGEEKKYPGEERILIPSPREVATYDEKPEMSAPEVTDAVIRGIKEDAFDVIILNFANGDMVGHTGVYEAAVSAVEAVDRCVGRIFEVLDRKEGTLLITSDHGNCEMMREPGSSEPFTAHTVNPVPLVLTRKGIHLRGNGILADIAPTLLELLGIPQPPEMTGRSLILDENAH
ncbi:MAG: 2,3-bisphosphoglycerate-independent phosphoglycerate mutase [Deltaproteobacteria bacterium]|nr:2,3-bisphosphoglycerate-independent phosphoglycerate mutase [Deltaproteobacteria bacterium]